MKTPIITAICIAILAGLSGFQAIGQGNDAAKPKPLGVFEIVRSLETPTYSRESKESAAADANRRTLQLIRTRCNVDFIDDGTNYWVLRVMGATEDLLREIDNCRSPERKKQLSEELRTTDEVKTHIKQKLLLADVIRFMFYKRDLAGRLRIIKVCKEYLRRYENDDHSDADELLKWIKHVLPRMEENVRQMQIET